MGWVPDAEHANPSRRGEPDDTRTRNAPRAGHFPLAFMRSNCILGNPVRQPRCAMPIYEFECTTCGSRFDRLQKLSDPDPDACPECGKPTVKRRVTAPSFRLAGSGWYETDFKKDGDKKRNLADSTKGESKSESAPASAESKSGEAKKPEAKPAESKKEKPAAKPAE